MSKALDKCGADNPEPRIKLSKILILNSEFLTNNTYKLFMVINIKIEFLKIHPKAWKNNNEYLDACEKN
jgi:hypothetical protein